MDEKERSKLTATENETCAAEEIAEAGQEIEEEIAQESAQKAVLRKIWDSVGYLVVPVVVVFLLLGVIFSLAWVPSGSMEPTLPTKSYFFGWRLPYFVGDPTPARGDIIMFRSDELDELLVKRVVGLPGDTVQLQDGYVYVNGALLEEDYLSQQGITYQTGSESVFEVPEDCVLVMGDNRTGSYDSRAWNDPYVPVEKIRSKALVDIAFLPSCTWRGVRYLY